MATDETHDTRLVGAGVAALPLIADPKSWINRRVERIALLSHEEVRRHVSIDFTLSDEQLQALRTDDGIVAPIAVLLKERRRSFDLRDEGGNAIPVLGKGQNGTLSLIALLSAASAALPPDVPAEEFEGITADLRRIVFAPPVAAEQALAEFVRPSADRDSSRARIAADPTCKSLLDGLWANYVLFAVLADGGPNRRILKYGYGDDVDLSTVAAGLRESIAPSEIARRIWHPDRRRFLIDCPSAWRARSFHAEIIIPEELRFDEAVLYDFAHERQLSPPEHKVNRAALYASQEIDAGHEVVAAVEIAPEGAGRLDQASVTSTLVASLLWLGALSGLDAGSPDAAVSILLGGAALFSGVTAVLGEHRLVSMIFSTTRQCLVIVTLAALVGSATLAMEVPDAHPTGTWYVAAALCTLAAIRLTWSSIRARA